MNEVATKKSNRILYLDLLRILATIAVIVVHVTATYINDVNVVSLEWNTLHFLNGLFRGATPIFVMISGIFFLDNSKEITLKSLFKKNILHIVTAFFFWSVIYAVTGLIVKGGTVLDLFMDIFKGHYHMWFLFMIVAIYLITPLLRKITESKKLTKYFLILALIFTFIIPTILLVLKTLGSMDIIDSGVYSYFKELNSYFYFNFTIGFSAYYVLGYYLATNDINIKWEIIIYILGIIGIVFTIVATKYLSYYSGELNAVFHDHFSLNILCKDTAIFVFCKNRVSKILKGDKTTRIIGWLSKRSFGVYLVHAEFIEILGLLGFTALRFNALLSTIGLILATLILSYLLTALLYKIPFFKKHFL